MYRILFHLFSFILLLLLLLLLLYSARVFTPVLMVFDSESPPISSNLLIILVHCRDAIVRSRFSSHFEFPKSLFQEHTSLTAISNTVTFMSHNFSVFLHDPSISTTCCIPSFSICRLQEQQHPQDDITFLLLIKTRSVRLF